jgi:hypothetical protein
LVGLCCSLFWFLSVVLLCVFTFWVLCCDVRGDFCIGRWSSCLSEGSCFVIGRWSSCLSEGSCFVIGRWSSCLSEGSCFVIGRWSSCLSEGSCFVCAVYVCLPVMVSDACFCFVFLRHVWSVVPVFLNCQFLITPSVFFNVYLRVTKQKGLIRIAEIEILWCDVIDDFNV